MIYQKMLSRSNYLEEKIQMLKTEIANLPDGKICCVHESKRVKWMYKKLIHTSILGRKIVLLQKN